MKILKKLNTTPQIKAARREAVQTVMQRQAQQKRVLAKSYPPPSWSVRQVVRLDRFDRCVEDVCQHGIGHPNRAWLATQRDAYAGIHGCDGCCHKPNAST